ncbi:MAG: hypothetical protein K8I30_01310, partial [Anaerolineae bacterium]|nr:hypothetical protein [Anaerolineae bacterium]
MLRFLAILIVLMSVTTLAAQNILEVGDPPAASLITVSLPDENGLVTVTGAAGAVFPSAQIAIRNLYTGKTVYVQGGITGSFTAQIEATANTPFWISPASTIPTTVRDRPGSLPGGPGTIVYGPFPETPAETTGITRLVIDGRLDDWQQYPEARLGAVGLGLVNHNSFYIGFSAQDIPTDHLRLEVSFNLDGTQYALALDPRLEEQTATLRRLDPNPANIGTLAVAAIQAEAVELRIPLEAFSLIVGQTVELATLDQIRFLGVEDSELLRYSVEQPAPILDERDGIVYAQPLENATNFALAGTLAHGAFTWQAGGRINTLNFEPGDELRMQLDITMNTPELPASLTGLSLIGQLLLQPVVGADGAQVSGGLYTQNGWSDDLTPSGLVIDNLRGEIALGEAMSRSQQVLRQGDQLIFGLDFALTLPDTLPAGLYVPVFRGFGQVGDGDRFTWEENSLLGASDNPAEMPWNRLPLVFNVGAIEPAHLVWTLFQDHPSSGSRGLMAVEDAGALSNRVRFNNPTYILPPSFNGEALAYPLEPYWLAQMPNAYGLSTAPLIPFFFPNGRLDVAVTKPDGTVLNLNSSALVQNRLSTPAEDERLLFGAQSQVDVYRLTTLKSE